MRRLPLFGIPASTLSSALDAQVDVYWDVVLPAEENLHPRRWPLPGSL